MIRSGQPRFLEEALKARETGYRMSQAPGWERLSVKHSNETWKVQVPFLVRRLERLQNTQSTRSRRATEKNLQAL